MTDRGFNLWIEYGAPKVAGVPTPSLGCGCNPSLDVVTYADDPKAANELITNLQRARSMIHEWFEQCQGRYSPSTMRADRFAKEAASWVVEQTRQDLSIVDITGLDPRAHKAPYGVSVVSEIANDLHVSFRLKSLSNSDWSQVPRSKTHRDAMREETQTALGLHTALQESPSWQDLRRMRPAETCNLQEYGQAHSNISKALSDIVTEAVYKVKTELMMKAWDNSTEVDKKNMLKWTRPQGFDDDESAANEAVICDKMNQQARAVLGDELPQLVTADALMDKFDFKPTGWTQRDTLDPTLTVHGAIGASRTPSPSGNAGKDQRTAWINPPILSQDRDTFLDDEQETEHDKYTVYTGIVKNRSNLVEYLCGFQKDHYEDLRSLQEGQPEQYPAQGLKLKGLQSQDMPEAGQVGWSQPFESALAGHPAPGSWVNPNYPVPGSWVKPKEAAGNSAPKTGKSGNALLFVPTQVTPKRVRDTSQARSVASESTETATQDSQLSDPNFQAWRTKVTQAANSPKRGRSPLSKDGPSAPNASVSVGEKTKHLSPSWANVAGRPAKSRTARSKSQAREDESVNPSTRTRPTQVTKAERQSGKGTWAGLFGEATQSEKKEAAPRLGLGDFPALSLSNAPSSTGLAASSTADQAHWAALAKNLRKEKASKADSLTTTSKKAADVLVNQAGDTLATSNIAAGFSRKLPHDRPSYASRLAQKASSDQQPEVLSTDTRSERRKTPTERPLDVWGADNPWE